MYAGRGARINMRDSERFPLGVAANTDPLQSPKADPWHAFAQWRQQKEIGGHVAVLDVPSLSEQVAQVVRLSSDADAFFAKGNSASAEECIRSALDHAPDNCWLLFQLGHVMEQQGRTAEGLRLLKQGLVDFNFDPVQSRIDEIEVRLEGERQSLEAARTLMADADRLMGEAKFMAADELLVEVLKIGKFELPALIKRANIAINSGALDEARALINRAGELGPGNKWVAFNRALIEEIEGNTDKALEEINVAIERDPDNTPFQNARRRLELSSRQDDFELGVYERVTGRSEAKTGDPLKILCWDLSHNPAGRAMALAEVASEFSVPEIVGPILTAQKNSVWPPLDGYSNAAARSSWPVLEPAHFFVGAIHYVMENPCDRVWVSKARFPSVFLGCLYKLIHNSAVVVDFDDDELAFVNAEEAIDVKAFLENESEIDWSDLASPMWGQLATSMAQWADAFTTCNEVLQAQHPGQLVRHARNETVFNAADMDRAEIRGRLGFAERDKIILFMGTPRRHKGILNIARAVAELDDPDAVLLIVGGFTDDLLEADLKKVPNLRFVHLEDQPLSVAAEINFAADLCTAFQDAESRIAQTQTPAKLTDAAAMGRLSITSDIETVTPFIDAGAAIVPVVGETLSAALRRGIITSAIPYVSEQIRAFFELSLSSAANAPAALRAFDDAKTNLRDLPSEFLDLLNLIARRVPLSGTEQTRDFLQKYTGPSLANPRVTSFNDDLDVVFFWKQNDTGIYDRRQDCVFRALADLPNVRKILHIDAPINADTLMRFAGSDAANDEGRLVARNTISRFLNTSDETDIHHRSFVYAGRTTELLGRKLDMRSNFAVRVAQWMEELDIGANVLAWVCPVVPEFKSVQDLVGFQDVVVDVIDNQNLWPMRPDSRKALIKSYAHIFDASSVTFSNCEPVAEWLRKSGLDPVVVPNGLNIPQDGPAPKTPSFLKGITTPIVGYVGNMSDRVDWSLLLKLADARPDWSFLMIGKLPRVKSDEFLEFQSRPQVLMPGVVPAHQMSDWYAAVDVGLIPHLDTDLSRAMNPLKLYVFRANGLRVVSTPIQNIGDFDDDIIVARGVDETVEALSNAIEDMSLHGSKWPASEVLDKLSWKSRVSEMMDHVVRSISSNGKQDNDGN